jgi:hypothetical protein
MLIVFDALDECDDKESMAEFIQNIIDVFRDERRLAIRIFCTSRIEEHLQDKLQAPTVHALDLRNFDAHADIRKFFRYRLSDIHKKCPAMRSLHPWPADTDLEALVCKSEGSFIFAETLVNFINDGTDLPHRKIQKALTTDAGLDTLYAEVLSVAPRTIHFERVIGTVMLLSRPIPVTFLGYLLHLETADVLQALFGLQSILLIPANDNQPVQLFHTSLRDFLITQPRSGPFFIDPPTRHLCIATDCLVAIMIPPENGVFDDEARDYACFNWCNRVLSALTESGAVNIFGSASGDAFVNCIRDFAERSVDFWVNTIISKGTRRILDILRSALSRLKVSQIFCIKSGIWS